MSDNEQVESSQENTEEVSAAQTLYPESSEETSEAKVEDQQNINPEEESTKGDAEPQEGEQSEEKEAEGQAGEGDTEYDLKMPEETLLEETVKDEVISMAKEKGLSNEQAQEVLNMQSKAISNYHEKALENLHQEVEAWGNEIRSDKEIGGENLPQNAELAKRAVKHFAGEDFLTELDETGYGNHPRLFKLLVNVGKEIESGGLVLAGAQPSQPKSMADVFYPKDK